MGRRKGYIPPDQKSVYGRAKVGERIIKGKITEDQPQLFSKNYKGIWNDR